MHIILEHWNFEMQFLLDDFCEKNMTLQELIEEYNAIGNDGVDISVYS